MLEPKDIYSQETSTGWKAEADLRKRALSAASSRGPSGVKSQVKRKKKKEKKRSSKNKSSPTVLTAPPRRAAIALWTCLYNSFWWRPWFLCGARETIFLGGRGPVSSCWHCWLLNPPLMKGHNNRIWFQTKDVMMDMDRIWYVEYKSRNWNHELWASYAHYYGVICTLHGITCPSNVYHIGVS